MSERGRHSWRFLLRHVERRAPDCQVFAGSLRDAPRGMVNLTAVATANNITVDELTRQRDKIASLGLVRLHDDGGVSRLCRPILT